MINIKAIKKSYEKRDVLCGISLDIREGEITFIVGRSGCGKSTFLNILGGLEIPDEGSVLYNGKDISEDLDSYRRTEVGFVFQGFNLVDGLSALENIKLAQLYAGTDISDDMIEDNLKRFGIKDPFQPSETLSGGEMQRTALLRSSLKNCDVIIADEPTGSLDEENSAAVFDLLRGMKDGRHVIVVTHDLAYAREYADRIIELKDGLVRSDEIINRSVESADQKERVCHKASDNKNIVKMLGFNSVKHRIKKMIPIMIVLALTVGIITVTATFGGYSKRLEKSVNIDYLESDLVSVKYGHVKNASFGRYPLSDADMEKLIERYDPKEMVPKYEYNQYYYMEPMLSYGNSVKKISLKQIKRDEFFSERIMSLGIEGNFISSEDEIIIAEDAAKELFGTSDCIGKHVELEDNCGHKQSMLIVGVNKIVNPHDEIYTYADAAVFKEFTKLTIEDEIKERLVVNKKREELYGSYGDGFYGGAISFDGIEAADGRLPADDNEIMVSTFFLKNAKLDYKSLIESEWVIEVNGVFEVAVCGVFESEKPEIAISEALRNKILEVEPVKVDMYLKDVSKVEGICEELDNEGVYAASAELTTLKGLMNRKTRFYELVFMAIGVIFTVISIFMLGSFVKLLVLERNKEIAILKSLGADDKNVRAVLMYDIYVIMLGVAMMSAVFSGVIMAVVNVILKHSSLIAIGYPLIELMLVYVLFFVVAVLYTTSLVKKNAGKSPAWLFSHIY